MKSTHIAVNQVKIPIAIAWDRTPYKTDIKKEYKSFMKFLLGKDKK